MKRVYAVGLRLFAWMAWILSSTLVGNAGIVTFDVSSQPGNQASTSPVVAPNVFATSLVRGPGLNTASGIGSFNASGFTTMPSIDLTDYFQFTVTAAPGYALDLEELVLGERRSLTGVREFQIRTSLDQFTTFTSQYSFSVPDSDALRDHSISLTGLSGVTDTVDIRIYGFAAESSAGTWRLVHHSDYGGIVLNGTVAAVPEPSSALLFGTAMMGGFWFRRRMVRRGSESLHFLDKNLD